MPNTSATGGFLTPTATNGDLNDDALQDFLQSIVVGVTGMDPTLVRPRWQPEDPNRPAYGTNWAGIGVQRIKNDKFTYVKHEGIGEGFDRQYRQQELEVLCTFYGPNVEQNSNLFSMGFHITQNLEALELAGFGLIEIDDPIVVPELDHQRWLHRIDIGLRLRRVQIYDYPVLNVLSGQVAVKNDIGAPEQDAIITWDTVVQMPYFSFDLELPNIAAGFNQGNLSK